MPKNFAVMYRFLLGSVFFSLALQSPAQEDAQAGAAVLTLKTTVRRVVLDVVVTDAQGKPVPGLTRQDFFVLEDGKPQTILSFESTGFQAAMDYLPPKLPPEPPNTFVNLPTAAEKGPLYVLLYDLVNMDNEDQMSGTANQHDDQIRGRQQLVKFIQNKPEGARFAIFVWSDGLHLVQGFTSDKAQLFAAIDPQTSRPHVPKVFLMGENSGRANVGATLGIFSQIGSYLNGLPGRKNLIWFSGTFPLSFYPSKDDGPVFVDQIKTTLNLLAGNQISIYPVDVRGVVTADWRSTAGLEDDGPIVSDRNKGAPSGGVDPSTQDSAGKAAHQSSGQSLITASYGTMDEVARQTGGRAFYGNNDVSAELIAATETGSSFYTLAYSSTNHNYDGGLRTMRVQMEQKGYHLAYRQTYYALDSDGSPTPVMMDISANAASDNKRQANDSFDAYMKHGAPAAHQLLFAAHVRAMGTPAKGTPAQMAQLTQASDARVGKKGASAKILKPVVLQHFTIDYTVMGHQLRLQESHVSMNLELAAAAYDSEGTMLNSVVAHANDSGATTNSPPKLYRAAQEMDVPLIATSIRIAVQDGNTGRIGAMEIKLPLPPEDQTAATAIEK